MDLTVKDITSAARAEAAKMQTAVKGRDPALKVSMTVGQFTILAGLIDDMCDLLARPDSRSFGEARYWVPLEVFAKLRDSAKSLDRQCAELRRSLEQARMSPSGLETLRLPAGSFSLEGPF